MEVGAFSFERNNAFSDRPITERQAIQRTNENWNQTHVAGLRRGKTCSILSSVATEKWREKSRQYNR